MAKAEYGSPKYIAKQMKSRGLQRLRWYCQVCEKQCRDENGYKCHTQAPSHVANLRQKGDRKHTEQYSRQFEAGFLHVLRLSHGTKSIDANRVYNEYIHDKTHIHMTATKWPSLAAFIRHLATTGVCNVETITGDGPPEFIITLIDHAAEQRQHKQEQAKEQRVQANESATQAVLQAQLRAAQEDKISNALSLEQHVTQRPNIQSPATRIATDQNVTDQSTLNISNTLPGINQSGTNQSGTNQSGTSQSGTNHSGTNHSGSSHSGSSHSGINHSGSSQFSTSQLDMNQLDTNQLDTNESKASQLTGSGGDLALGSGESTEAKPAKISFSLSRKRKSN